MNITDHFSLEELVASEVSARRGIDNSLPDALLPNIKILCTGLERVREILGNQPLHVNSAFRSPDLNKAVGGARNSWHLKALAADIICPAYGNPLEICRKLAASDLGYEQLIHEYRSWCHVAFPEAGMTPRFQKLTIVSASQGYTQGLS